MKLNFTKKKSKKGKEKERKEFFSALSTSSQLGFSIAIPIVVGALIGSYLDKVLGTKPFLTLFLLLIGVVVGCSSIFLLIREQKE